jgi:hypothetical protein
MTDRKGRRRTEKERQMNVSTGINKFQEITMTPNRKKKKSRKSKSRAMAVSYMSKSRILKFHFSRKSNLGDFIKDSGKSKQIPT